MRGQRGTCRFADMFQAMRHFCYRNWCWFLSLACSRDNGLPSMRTLALALVSFILSLLLGTVFAWNKTSPNALIFILVILAVAVGFFCLADWLRRRRARPKESPPPPVYARNHGNTVATSIINLIAIPLLYLYVWYPGLNQDVTTFEIDTVVCLASTPVPTYSPSELLLIHH